jgi:hypothetical protein
MSGSPQGVRIGAGNAPKPLTALEERAHEAGLVAAAHRRQANHAQAALEALHRQAESHGEHAQAQIQYRIDRHQERAEELSQDAVAMAPERGSPFPMASPIATSPASSRARWCGASANHPPQNADEFGTFLREAQADWSAETADAIGAARGNWFNRGKTFKAHATFVGAQLADGDRKLHVTAIGNSVIFHVRDNKS